MVGARRKIRRQRACSARLLRFPGNVRELANVIERAVIVAEGADVGAEDLPESVRTAAESAQGARGVRRSPRLEAEYVSEIA